MSIQKVRVCSTPQICILKILVGGGRVDKTLFQVLRAAVKKTFAFYVHEKDEFLLGIISISGLQKKQTFSSQAMQIKENAP